MILPEILIVADYKNLHAYLILPDGLPEIVETIDFENDGPTNIPLVEWTDDQEGYVVVATKIAEIVANYQSQSWGLACPPLLSNKITNRLPPAIQASLTILRQMNVDEISVSNVLQVFNASAKDYNSEKEHC